jgi:membrane protease YdiL (CAAX protease family)
LLFRGCVFGRFEAYRYGVSGAIVSALMFAVVHGVPALLPFYFGVGIILAWLCSWQAGDPAHPPTIDAIPQYGRLGR